MARSFPQSRVRANAQREEQFHASPEVPPTQPSKLRQSKAQPKAHVRALRWLTRRDYSALELRTRLEAEGYSNTEIEEALDWLQSGHWQSDERFAGSLARRRSGAFGSRLIRAELQHHQVDDQSIADALAALERSDVDRAVDWLEKRSRGHTLTPENQAKWYRALLARGFRSDDIRIAFRRLQGNDA